MSLLTSDRNRSCGIWKQIAKTTRWNESGWRTVEQVKSGDQKKNVPKGATGQLGKEELDAIRRALQEG